MFQPWSSCLFALSGETSPLTVAETFLKTLKSALNQTYKNFEIIIVYDDPSRTDLEYIKRIAKFWETKMLE